MPTIFDPEESHLSTEFKYLKSPVSVPRKSPTKWVSQQDQFKLFEVQDKIKSFDNIYSTLTPPGYTFQKYDDHIVFTTFKLMCWTSQKYQIVCELIETFMLFYKG